LTPADPSTSQHNPFIEAAHQVVSLRKNTESSGSSMNLHEVFSIASGDSSPSDEIQEWMDSVPIDSSPPFRKGGSKRVRETPSSPLFVEARTPSIGKPMKPVRRQYILTSIGSSVRGPAKKGSVPSPSIFKELGVPEPLPKRQKFKQDDDLLDLYSLPEYPAPAKQRRALVTSQSETPSSSGLPKWARDGVIDLL
jgi:hypothetical protein